MHDVAVNCVRSKDAQKQLARTSLIDSYVELYIALHVPNVIIRFGKCKDQPLDLIANDNLNKQPQSMIIFVCDSTTTITQQPQLKNTYSTIPREIQQELGHVVKYTVSQMDDD